MLDQVLVPIHRAGWPFIAGFFAVAIVLGFLWQPLFWIGLVASLWCLYFFRDPPRVTPARVGLVVSPADGRIQFVGGARPPAELDLGDEALTRVSIFLNIFDVHVNRMPVDGKVVVARTKDGGDSFELLSEGLPQDDAYDVVYRHGLDVHQDGQRLAMGSTTGSLWVSDDGGDSWTTVSTHLPPVYCVRFG